MLTICHLWFLSYTRSHTFVSPWAVFACCCLSWALVSSLESRIWMILEHLSDHSAVSLTGRGSDSKNWGSKTCFKVKVKSVSVITWLEIVFSGFANLRPVFMLSSAVLMSLVLSFVLCLRSAFSVLPLCGVQWKTRQQSAKQPIKTPQSPWCCKRKSF